MIEHQTQTESYTYEPFASEWYISTFDRITKTSDGDRWFYDWEIFMETREPFLDDQEARGYVDEPDPFWKDAHMETRSNDRIRITVNGVEDNEDFIYLTDMYVSVETFDQISDEDFYLTIGAFLSGWKKDQIFLCPEDGPEYDRWNRMQEEGYYRDRAREEGVDWDAYYQSIGMTSLQAEEQLVAQEEMRREFS